jgi:hypothetical protein
MIFNIRRCSSPKAKVVPSEYLITFFPQFAAAQCISEFNNFVVQQS